MGQDFEAVVEFLEENDAPPELVKAAKGSGLRKQVSELSAEVERLKTFETEVEKFKKAPVREKFFKDVAKVDFDNLRPAEKKLIESFDWEGDEPTAEAVTEFVSTYELPTVTGAPSATQELGGAAAIANQASTANPSFPPPANSTREQIAEYEQTAAQLRAEGKIDEAVNYTRAAMTLKTASLRPEGLEAAPA